LEAEPNLGGAFFSLFFSVFLAADFLGAAFLVAAFLAPAAFFAFFALELALLVLPLPTSLTMSLASSIA